jgi:hypothetical protein
MKRAAFFCLVAGCVLGAALASRRGLAEGRWAHPPRAPSPGTASPAQTTPPAARSPADTTRRRVKAGEVLITTLPARVSGRRVAAYDLLRAPALSDLAGRSFFWRTRPPDAGRHRLLFGARFDPTATAPADTLAMIVKVTSSG